MAKRGARKPKANPGTRDLQARMDSYGDRGKDPWNPFSHRVARAKVLLEQGFSLRKVSEETGLAQGTVQRVKRGEYDPGLPVALLDKMRASESGKLTLIRGRILDEILESDVIENANLVQLATGFGILTDKQELLEGRPTARVDHLLTMPDDQLEQERDRTLRELLQRAQLRGMPLNVTEAEISPPGDEALPSPTPGADRAL